MTEQELSDLIQQRFDTLDADFKQLTEEVRKTNERVDRTNDRVETYQKASQQVVNLAFGLILTAAAAIILPVVFAR